MMTFSALSSRRRRLSTAKCWPPCRYFKRKGREERAFKILSKPAQAQPTVCSRQTVSDRPAINNVLCPPCCGQSENKMRKQQKNLSTATKAEVPAVSESRFLSYPAFFSSNEYLGETYLPSCSAVKSNSSSTK